ncbi:hypothetical protein PF008_g3363 [Phytophthora fragariae]|uniref:Uncharacterized protein n=1 Tax=Phytophthora fragariae TaxID=53985 RepID=A0A6G0SF71_9STRA|nr:hypothetical protein PF008_g3363 [Phytophthora fragariae]
MVCVNVWRKAALLALCQSLLTPSDASVSIIERDVVPTVFETSAAMSDSMPVWLVLPMLLDVQPVLMKVDVTRHVPAQVQSFCREHGVDVTRCAGAIQEALDEVVNFQRFCKKPRAENALPGFVVAKNVLRGDGESASASWLQNDPEDVALDFCGFSRTNADESSAEKCAEALGTALRLSFDWMRALAPCDQQRASTSEVHLQDTESPSLKERLATVEQMIAELQSAPVEESEVDPTTQEDEAAQPPSDENVDSVEGISEVGESVPENSDDSDKMMTSTPIMTEVIQDEVAVREIYEIVEASKHSDGELADATLPDDTSSTKDSRPIADDNVFEATRISTPTSDLGTIESALAAGNGSCEAVLQDRGIGEALEPQKSWKVGAALVLALSIMYLTIDLMLHWVHHAAGYLGTQKQLVNVLVHDILLLVGGGPRSTLADSYSNPEDGDLKKPVTEQSTVLAAAECSEAMPLQQPSKESDAEKSEVNCLAETVAPKKNSSPSPSFACVAMMLMAGRQAPISHDQFPMMQDTFERTLRAAAFMKIHDEMTSNCTREQAAAQRIQKAWKASQCKSSLSNQGRGTKPIALVIPVENAPSKSHPCTPLFRLLQLNSKKAAQPPRADKVSAGFHRLVPSTLPPL